MIEFTFDGLFRTTNKGLPDTSSLDPYSYISMSFFINSVAIQIILGLVILVYTGMSVYRAFYKIRNEKFFPEVLNHEEQQKDQNENQTQKSKSQMSGEGQQKSNADLIYRFDGDQNQKEGEDKEKEQEQKQSEMQDDNEEGANDQTTEWFLKIDHQLNFLQPFLIGFIIMNNVFIANPIIVIALVLALVLFFLFNIKQFCVKHPILQNLFMIPCIIVMAFIFFEDLDMQT